MWPRGGSPMTSVYMLNGIVCVYVCVYPSTENVRTRSDLTPMDNMQTVFSTSMN